MFLFVGETNVPLRTTRVFTCAVVEEVRHDMRMGMAGRASAIAQRNSSVVSLGLIVLELYAHAAAGA
jgi:hypothetical protein